MMSLPVVNTLLPLLYALETVEQQARRAKLVVQNELRRQAKTLEIDANKLLPGIRRRAKKLRVR